MTIPFHSTMYGRIFFEGQLPALIRELRRLGDSAERTSLDEMTMTPKELDKHYPELRPLVLDLVGALNVWGVSNKTIWRFLEGYKHYAVTRDPGRGEGNEHVVSVTEHAEPFEASGRDFFEAGVRLMHSRLVP